MLKKALVLSLCVLGFILIAAPTAVEYHPVFLNGKSLGQAVVLQGGIIAISVEDFSKAGGSSMTLQPNFQVQGNRFSTVLGPTEQKKIVSPAYKEAPAGTAPNQAALVPAVHKAEIKIAPGQIFRVQNAGQITGNLMTFNGKAYIPLSDVAKAFGGTLTINGGTLKAGEAIRLNFGGTPNSILIGL